jgi:hypothetical protein
MKNLRILPILCLLSFFLLGNSNLLSAQTQYMSRQDAVTTVTKIMDQLEARYGQIDQNSEKPIKRNRGALTRTDETYLDIARIKIGNSLLKHLKAGSSVEQSFSRAFDALDPQIRKSPFYIKADEYYKSLLSI